MSSRIVSSSISRLCELLRQEEAACHQLLDTVQAERRAIRELDIAQFHGINCRRLSILEVLKVLAEQRECLVQDLSAHHGLPSSSSLHELVDRLPGSATEFRACYATYIASAKTVREEIKQNALLIEGIRGVIDQALSVQAPVAQGHDLYTAGGQSFIAGRVNMLIHQQG